MNYKKPYMGTGPIHVHCKKASGKNVAEINPMFVCKFKMFPSLKNFVLKFTNLLKS